MRHDRRSLYGGDLLTKFEYAQYGSSMEYESGISDRMSESKVEPLRPDVTTITLVLAFRPSS